MPHNLRQNESFAERLKVDFSGVTQNTSIQDRSTPWLFRLVHSFFHIDTWRKRT